MNEELKSDIDEFNEKLKKVISNYDIDINSINEEIEYNSLREKAIRKEEVIIKESSNKADKVLFPSLIKKNMESDINNELKEIESKLKELREKRVKLNDKKNTLLDLEVRAIDITENYLMIDKNKNISDNKLKKEIGLKVLKTQEKERQRIARDLHDSIIQNITSFVHKTEYIIKLLNIDKTSARLELISMKDDIKSTIDEMRSIIYDLRPMILDDLGLITTLEKYARELMALSKIKVAVNSNVKNIEIDKEINLSIFRIVQEACNNAIKHAGPSEIIIGIDKEKDRIVITIEDDGKGFDFDIDKCEIIEESSGMGLSIIKERTYLLSGEFAIESKKNQGTKLKIKIPLNLYEEDCNDKTD